MQTRVLDTPPPCTRPLMSGPPGLAQLRGCAIAALCGDRCTAELMSREFPKPSSSIRGISSKHRVQHHPHFGTTASVFCGSLCWPGTPALKQHPHIAAQKVDATRRTTGTQMPSPRSVRPAHWESEHAAAFHVRVYSAQMSCDTQCMSFALPSCHAMRSIMVLCDIRSDLRL